MDAIKRKTSHHTPKGSDGSHYLSGDASIANIRHAINVRRNASVVKSPGSLSGVHLIVATLANGRLVAVSAARSRARTRPHARTIKYLSGIAISASLHKINETYE